MRARSALVGLVVLAVALSGCLAATDPAPVTPADDDGGNGTTAGPGEDVPDDTVPATPGLPTPFRIDGQENHVTLVRNGSFTFYQSCLPVGCFTGDSEEGLDLTPETPVGVPAVVNVTLEYDQDVVNYVGLDLAVDGAEVYTLDVRDGDGQTVHLDAVVARTNPQDEVVVQAQGFYPDDGSAEYTMRARVAAHPGILTHRVPTELQVPAESDGFTLGFADTQGSFQATVWGPSDKLVGHYEVTPDPGEPDNVTVRLGPDHEPGRYVILVRGVSLPPGHTHPSGTNHHHHGVVARPLGDTATPAMQTLGLRYREAGNYPVSSGDSVTWEPTPPKAPLQMGIVARPPSGLTVNPATLSGSLQSSSGEVLSFQNEGFLLGFGGYTWISSVGDPALDEGTYTARFHNDGGTQVEVGHVVGFYER
jgi:hypothetical protein